MARSSVLPANPDDNSASKSFLKPTSFAAGTEFTIEIRSPYDGVSTHRLGELVVWMGVDDALTARAYAMGTDAFTD